MTIKLLSIFVGAGFGALLRYFVAGWFNRMVEQPEGLPHFPIGTLMVNFSGCLLIGLVGVFLFGHHARVEWRLALLVGVLGGYTTFSSFGWETLDLLRNERIFVAGLNVLLTNAVCLIAVWIGFRIGERLLLRL